MIRGSYRHYANDIKRQIAITRNPRLFPNLDIPRSTAYQWIRIGVPSELENTARETHSERNKTISLPRESNETHTLVVAVIQKVIRYVPKNREAELVQAFDEFKKLMAPVEFETFCNLFPYHLKYRLFPQHRCPKSEWSMRSIWTVSEAN